MPTLVIRMPRHIRCRPNALSFTAAASASAFEYFRHCCGDDLERSVDEALERDSRGQYNGTVVTAGDLRAEF